MATLNTALQQQLVKSSEDLRQLSKTTISTVTGGNSFCYMDFGIPKVAAPTDTSWPFFTAIGDSPLFDVHASIVDQRKADKLINGHPETLGMELLNVGRTNIDVGNFVSPRLFHARVYLRIHRPTTYAELLHTIHGAER